MSDSHTTKTLTLAPHYFSITPTVISGREKRESSKATPRKFTIDRAGVRSLRWETETGWLLLPWFGIGSVPIVPDLTEKPTAEFVAWFTAAHTPKQHPVVTIDGDQA